MAAQTTLSRHAYDVRQLDSSRGMGRAAFGAACSCTQPLPARLTSHDSRWSGHVSRLHLRAPTATIAHRVAVLAGSLPCRSCRQATASVSSPSPVHT